MSLQEMRKKRGYSQSALSEITGISAKNIQHYESGYRDINKAQLATLCAFALALECKIDDILTDEDLKSKLMTTQRHK